MDIPTDGRYRKTGDEAMLGFPLIVANDIERMRIEEAARRAPRAWRHQQLRIRGRKAVARILTSILAFSIGSLAP